MTSGDGDSLDEGKALRKENMRLERRLRQLERGLRTFENVARQSKSAMERSLEELRQRTIDLEAAKDAAEAGLATKDRFLATISHEIRTPMNGVIGCIDLLTQGDLKTEDRELVDTLKGSAENLMTLLNDVLDFAKIQEGETVIESRPLDIKHLVTGVCAPERARCSVKGVEIMSSIDPALPTNLLGDAHRLRQILSNLVGNAVKFTPSGSITVDVTRSDDGTLVHFNVTDTGIGMESQALDSVFSAFTQADETTARRFGGTGLGLAISSSLVAAMGGELRVSSEFGAGSCFYFSIPLLVGKLDEEEETPLNEPIDAAPVRFPCDGMRVLLVDDNPVNRVVGRKLVERLGADVELATGGREAAIRAFEEDWDAILMDCSMPEVDGFQATQMIRDGSAPLSKVHIIALTALSMQGDRERCLRAGMDDYITKPLRLPQLTQALKKAQEARSRRAA